MKLAVMIEQGVITILVSLALALISRVQGKVNDLHKHVTLLQEVPPQIEKIMNDVEDITITVQTPRLP